MALAPRFPASGPLGNLAEMRDRPLTFLFELARFGPDIARFRIGPYTAHLLVHPELIKEAMVDHYDAFDHGTRQFDVIAMALGRGLLLADGDDWRRQRRLVQPTFRKGRIAGFADVMASEVEALCDRWEDRIDVPFDLALEMMDVTMRVIARTMFSADVGDRATRLAQPIEEISAYLNEILTRILVMPLAVPTPANQRFKRARAFIDDFIDEVIASRHGAEQADDLLAMLMEAKDEETGQPMTPDQLRDQVKTIFMAGHETVAHALTWTGYLLGLHPGTQRAIAGELDAALGGRLPGLQDVPALAPVDRVLKEGLRLYPPGWLIGRRVVHDQKIGDVTLPAGSLAFMAPFVTQRDPRWWVDPEGFDPDRFLQPDPNRPKYAYFPFGAGARTCIGRGFAQLEMQLILGRILQRYHLSLEPGHPVVPAPWVTLTPRGGIWVRIKPRAA